MKLAVQLAERPSGETLKDRSDGLPIRRQDGVVPASRIQVVTQVTYNLLTWYPNHDQAKAKVFMVGDARQNIFFKRAAQVGVFYSVLSPGEVLFRCLAQEVSFTLHTHNLPTANLARRNGIHF